MGGTLPAVTVPVTDDGATVMTPAGGDVHACVTVRVSVSAGQAAPPPDGGVTMVRVRCSVRD
jgi:hypothetical protein